MPTQTNTVILLHYGCTHVKKGIHQSKLVWLGVPNRALPKDRVEGVLPRNTPREIFSSPHYAWEDGAETPEHQVDLGWERCCPWSFPIIFVGTICVSKLFLVLTTATFCPLLEYHIQIALTKCIHTIKINHKQYQLYLDPFTMGVIYDTQKNIHCWVSCWCDDRSELVLWFRRGQWLVHGQILDQPCVLILKPPGNHYFPLQNIPSLMGLILSLIPNN